MTTPWAGRATAGLRRGAARARVIEFLDRQECCVGAQEVHAELRAAGEPIGLASVYRVLETLADKGLVHRVDLGDGVTRFEPVRTDEEHHHHLVCDDCGKVEVFADARLERAIRDVEQRSGFEVAAHDIVLRGACSACR